ncbi:putative inorganic phosphate cotransporter [Pieris brassicae]|uniref:putative inorganic phosphate cotransporter n=1 Tax=Pieris brassicae TaxID=7116 RepID=UPI001E66125A|nr:putative inorganic phosphate cotransporter [Pieris brassicae]
MSEYKENNENTQKQDDLLCDQDVRYPKKDSALIKVLRKHCCIPQQWVFGVISLIGLCNAYTMRVTLNLAITQMVNRTKIEREHFDPDACPSEEIIGNITALVDKSHAIFDWNEEVQGFILSGFYYGYGITQILGGFLAEKYEAKWTLGIGLLTTAILTFLTPLITKIGGSTWLFILRVLQGMGEGPTIPALMIMMSRWTPPDKRAFQGALIFGGAQLGNMFGSLMGGTLMAGGRDWAYVFYFFGGFGVVWFIFWSFLCYNEPNQHPFISYKELDYLNRVVKRAKVSSSSDPVPWKAMLRSPAAWALLCAGIGHDWGFYTMVSDLPKYMHDVLKFNIAETGALTCLPFLAKWICGFIFGFTCDYGIKKGWHSVRMGRIIYTTIGSMLPATCIILASYSGCNRTVALGCFVLAMGFMGGYVSGMKVNILDVAPNHAGSVSAFINTITTFAGIISPYLIGLMTPDSTLVQWRRAFWICFVMMVGSNILYGFLADGKQQWWDDVRQFGYPSNWKHGPIIKEVPTEPESIKLCKKDEEETQK